MKQHPIRNSLFRFTLAAVLVAMVAGQLRGDTGKNTSKDVSNDVPKNAGKQTVKDKKAVKPDDERIEGSYAGNGVTFRVERNGDEASGVIIRNKQTFPFKGKVDGKALKGAFKNSGIAIDFSVIAQGDQLILTSGSSTYKLKRQAIVRTIGGTYHQGNNSISLSETAGQFKGYLLLNGQRHTITGEKQDQRVVGHYLLKGKKIPFSVSLEGDLLTVAVGLEQIKMQRVADAWEGAESKRKVSLSVLAKSSEVIDSTILVSPSNSHVAYATKHPKRFAFQVWVNGKVMQTDMYPGVGSRFSPDGQRYAHMMKKGEKYFVVIDDKLSDPYDQAIVHLDVFSTNSKRSIFAGRNGESWQIVVDGKAGPSFDRINKLFGFSTNGEHYAYIGERDGQWHMVIDGKVSPAYEAVLLSWQTFSADSKHIHYAIARNGKQVAVVDGKEIGEHDAIGDMRFSPAGDRFAYIVLEGSWNQVILDGKPGQKYEHVGSLEFSPDGKKLAYPVRVDGKSIMIVNDKKMGERYDQVSSPLFSADSKHVLFLAQLEGEQFTVLDGKPILKFDEVRIAIFSPDSKRVAFIARKGDLWFVVVDGKTSSPYFQEPKHLIFTPDSKHVVYVAKRDGSTYLTVDGTEGKPIWPMLPGSAIVFDDANRLHTVVRRGDEFIRLDVEIVK